MYTIIIDNYQEKCPKAYLNARLDILDNASNWKSYKVYDDHNNLYLSSDRS